MIPARYRASLAYLWRHPWQLGLAIIGVGTGVAVIVAVELANSGARNAFLLSMDAVAGEATHQLIGGPQGIDESFYTELRVRHGLRDIAPVVEGDARIGERVLHLLGVDLFAESELRDYTGALAAVEDGTEASLRALLIQPGAVAMSARTAASLGLVQGESFELLVDGVPHAATLDASFEDDGRLADLVVVDIATAQEWLGTAGRLTRIDVRIAHGDDAAFAELEALLPAGVRALDAAGRSRATADMAAGFMTNLAAMSLLALLVGLFLVLNSASFSVLQRRELIGTLRALGLTRRELFGMLLLEAAVIGLVAAVLGIALGVLLGEHLLALAARSINELYFRVSVTDVQVGPAAIVKGLLAGIGAALLGAAMPAWEATGYRPRLAMARSVLEQRTRRMLPFVTFAGLATIAMAIVVLAVSGRNLVAGLAAALMLILGFSLCTPCFVKVAAARLAPLAGKAGVAARMAVAGTGAGLSRTGIAVVALAVAVSATIGVSVMVDSFRVSVRAWLEQSLQADLYVRAERGAIDDALVADLLARDAVAAVSTTRRVLLEEADGRTWLIALRMAPGSYAGVELLDADPQAVWPGWDAGDTVVVSEPYAYYHGVARGDAVDLPTDRGLHSFTVAATYRSYDASSSSMLMSRSTYDRWFDDPAIDSIGVYLEAETSEDELVAALAAMATGERSFAATSNRDIREASLAVFDRTFVITGVLYWLTLGVAFIGILSAMLALELERAREIATLRALGMTPAQVGGMLTAQTGLLGLLAGIAAVPLGLVMAWVLIVVINRRAFGWQIDVSISPATVSASVAFAVAAAVLAGLYPAWRAMRMSPARAMREE